MISTPLCFSKRIWSCFWLIPSGAKYTPRVDWASEGSSQRTGCPVLSMIGHTQGQSNGKAKWQVQRFSIVLYYLQYVCSAKQLDVTQISMSNNKEEQTGSVGCSSNSNTNGSNHLKTQFLHLHEFSVAAIQLTLHKALAGKVTLKIFRQWTVYLIVTILQPDNGHFQLIVFATACLTSDVTLCWHL